MFRMWSRREGLCCGFDIEPRKYLIWESEGMQPQKNVANISSMFGKSTVTAHSLLRCWSGIKKAVPLHAMKALGGRGAIAPTHSRPRH
jgi:hypothetical protein